MFTLELKIPPLLLVLIFTVLMWLCAQWFTGFEFPGELRVGGLALFTALGLIIAGAGVVAFRRAKTTVNPTAPDTSSSLVTSGIYRRTRNPMYVGFLLCLIGWGLFLANLCSLGLVIVFVWYMNRFQIRPEEKVLSAVFGADYLDYQQRVRRWW